VRRAWRASPQESAQGIVELLAGLEVGETCSVLSGWLPGQALVAG
jgi:hypothetical protein